MEANQIRSYIVNLGSSQRTEEVQQEHLKLDFNSKLIGLNGEQQALFPGEITPAKIRAGAISFELVPNESMNSLNATDRN